MCLAASRICDEVDRKFGKPAMPELAQGARTAASGECICMYGTAISFLTTACILPGYFGGREFHEYVFLQGADAHKNLP
jgi:hypothetical protein